MVDQLEEVTPRDQTISLGKIDEEYIARLAKDTWIKTTIYREIYNKRKQLFEEAWRNLVRDDESGPWDGSSNFHVPLVLIYGKAVHARLWQIFSNPSGFFSVKSRTEAYLDKEASVKMFMDWVWNHRGNGGLGFKREMDRWLWDVVFVGSGYLKSYWKKEVREFSDTVPTAVIKQSMRFNSENTTGFPDIEIKTVDKEADRVEILESPQVRRILHEDIALPLGEHDPQESSFVITRVFMTDEDLKIKAQQGIYDQDAVDASLGHTEDIYRQAERAGDTKQQRASDDGIQLDQYDKQLHVIYEYYGKAYVAESVNEQEARLDEKLTQREIVAWVHKATNRVLGWTYLSRISPSGLRPLFKADYVTFPDRSEGVGVQELLYDTNRHIDSIYNLRVDAGTLASLPMFAYRSSSSLKPALMRMRPGQGIPVDDINDMKQFNFPSLTGFGYQEEATLTSYAEKILALSELNLGRAPEKVGALRNATGANVLNAESQIQLEIHFDRIAHCVSRLLQFLFVLCRERMPDTLFYRVTGDKGEPIFQKTTPREDLRGEYDFEIGVDILGQSQLEKQQQSTLMMQTLINPVFTQTGIVQPPNLYALAKNFLKANKVSRIDTYLSEPQGYQEVVTPAERCYRIAIGNFMNPPIVDTVQLGEDHDKALAFYQSFHDSDEFGLLRTPEQLQAFQGLIERANQLKQAQMAGSTPNTAGTQVPQVGMQAAPAAIGGGGTSLQGKPTGVPNGPVV